MIWNEEAIRNGWTLSETKPGYATKTMVFNIDNSTVTAIVNRPILTPEEQKKREEQVRIGLERCMRDYYRSKALKEENKAQ